MNGRKVVYFAYFINLLGSLTYCALALVTFDRVRIITRHVENNALKNSLLASTILGAIVVAFFQFYAAFILIWRIFASSVLGYGAVLGMSTHTGVFVLLSGLVVQANLPSAQAWHKAQVLSDIEKNVYVATYVFSYISAASHLMLWMVLLTFSSDMTNTTGFLHGERSDIDKEAKAAQAAERSSTSALFDTPATGSAFGKANPSPAAAPSAPPVAASSSLAMTKGPFSDIAPNEFSKSSQHRAQMGYDNV